MKLLINHNGHFFSAIIFRDGNFCDSTFRSQINGYEVALGFWFNGAKCVVYAHHEFESCSQPSLVFKQRKEEGWTQYTPSFKIENSEFLVIKKQEKDPKPKRSLLSGNANNYFKENGAHG